MSEQAKPPDRAGGRFPRGAYVQIVSILSTHYQERQRRILGRDSQAWYGAVGPFTQRMRRFGFSVRAEAVPALPRPAARRVGRGTALQLLPVTSGRGR